MAIAVALSGPVASAAVGSHAVRPVRYINPLTQGHRPLACPDPHVSLTRIGAYRYVLVCTSALAPDALPIYLSTDLVHWHRDGFVLPRGHQPWWALASTGQSAGGRYWAPEIVRIGRRWIVYFAAVYDPAKLHLAPVDGAPVPAGTMVLGVAVASSLRGPWRTSVLHYRGQLDAKLRADQREGAGSAIDPSVLTDPLTGRRYLFWTNGPDQIWEGELSANGLSLHDHRRIREVLSQSEPWECDPATKNCFVEAPEPFYHQRRLYLLYSGASTWDGSYCAAAAISSGGPAGPFRKLDRVLRSNNHFFGPGHTSQPIAGPDGKSYILYHALQNDERVLMLDRLRWRGLIPFVNDGMPGSGGSL